MPKKSKCVIKTKTVKRAFGKPITIEYCETHGRVTEQFNAQPAQSQKMWKEWLKAKKECDLTKYRSKVSK